MKNNREKKSVTAAVLLGLFLGPFGTFYTGWKTFLVFMALFLVGIIGIIAITSSAYDKTMVELEEEVDVLYADAYEMGAAAGAGVSFILLFIPYMGILGLSALITNVVSCQKHNNRVEKFNQEVAERRHQELMNKEG
ncbi:MAG: TM2 domain-containing protein [Gammaproteobacteria bacterium]|nr:TM2 domain-containing protein [Gammaproteobacteria bacterium]MYF01915.1 TM2 domain-containing protein [Gammaproteobacteria bacterium]MYI77464.1 TM2 domain-containing protein [Gammaproteobacteria bacterium]